MSGHTPGPWAAHQYGVRDSGGYICKLHWPHLYTGQDERYWKETAERQADARLIAAAPELLEALQSAREWHRGDKWRGTEKHDAWQAQADLLDAAIAKATQP